MHRKADEGGLPSRNATEENAARCVPGRRETSRDLGDTALVTGLDRRAPGARVPGLVWAGSHYGYLMLATALVRRSTGQRRRLAAVALTLGGIVLDRALGSAAVAPWFGPVYYAKLLLGHAGAALWPVQPAGSTPRGSRAGSQSSSSTARSKA